MTYLKNCDMEVIDQLQDWSAVLCAQARKCITYGTIPPSTTTLYL